MVCNGNVRFHLKFQNCITEILRVSQSKKCHKQKDLFRLQSSIYLPLHELQGCYSKPAKICKAVSLPNIQLRCAVLCVDNVWNMNRERGEKKKKIEITEFCLPLQHTSKGWSLSYFMLRKKSSRRILDS